MEKKTIEQEAIVLTMLFYFKIKWQQNSGNTCEVKDKLFPYAAAADETQEL